MLKGRAPHEDGRRKVEYSLLQKESLQNASPFLKERGGPSASRMGDS